MSITLWPKTPEQSSNLTVEELFVNRFLKMIDGRKRHIWALHRIFILDRLIRKQLVLSLGKALFYFCGEK